MQLRHDTELVEISLSFHDPGSQNVKQATLVQMLKLLHKCERGIQVFFFQNLLGLRWETKGQQQWCMSSKIRDQHSLHFPTGFSAKSSAKQEDILQDLV
jgi:hypothetical protein